MTGNHRILISLLGGAAMLAAAGVAHATVYDVSADFSLASNPNGVWTYGYENTLGATLNNYDRASNPAGLQVWQSSIVQSLGDPSDFNNPTGATINIGPGFVGTGTVNVPAHSAAFHPGPNDQFSVYRFTAPVAGTYTLAASFFPDDIAPGGTDVHILDNGVSLFAGVVDGSHSPTYSNTLGLAAGEIIDFAVGFGADGNFFSDSTGIIANLTTMAAAPIPEPASVVILGIALGALGFARGLRKTVYSVH